MLALLNWRVWAALALVAILTASHLTVYRKGKHVVQAEWTLSIAEANAEAMRLERARQSRVDEAGKLAATRTADDRNRAAGADRAIAGMRNTLDATERNAAQSLAAASATVSAYRAVFESCTAEYRAMGAEAAGHASDSLTYQQAWPK